MDCCKTGGCWKNKVVSTKVIDRCFYPVTGTLSPQASCMTFIKPSTVIKAILEYFPDMSCEAGTDTANEFIPYKIIDLTRKPAPKLRNIQLGLFCHKKIKENENNLYDVIKIANAKLTKINVKFDTSVQFFSDSIDIKNTICSPEHVAIINEYNGNTILNTLVSYARTIAMHASNDHFFMAKSKFTVVSDDIIAAVKLEPWYRFRQFNYSSVIVTPVGERKDIHIASVIMPTISPIAITCRYVSYLLNWNNSFLNTITEKDAIKLYQHAVNVINPLP